MTQICSVSTPGYPRLLRWTDSVWNKYRSISALSRFIESAVSRVQDTSERNTCAWERASELCFYQDQRYSEGNYLPSVIRRQWESLNGCASNARRRKQIVRRCRNCITMTWCCCIDSIEFRFTRNRAYVEHRTVLFTSAMRSRILQRATHSANYSALRQRSLPILLRRILQLDYCIEGTSADGHHLIFKRDSGKILRAFSPFKLQAKLDLLFVDAAVSGSRSRQNDVVMAREMTWVSRLHRTKSRPRSRRRVRAMRHARAIAINDPRLGAAVVKLK